MMDCWSWITTLIHFLKSLSFLVVYLYVTVLCDSGFKSKDGVPQMVKAYMERKVKLDEFITHNMTLTQVNEAIELMKRGGWYISRLVLSA